MHTHLQRQPGQHDVGPSLDLVGVAIGVTLGSGPQGDANGLDTAGRQEWQAGKGEILVP